MRVIGANSGALEFFGLGAGGAASASSVVGDILSAIDLRARGITAHRGVVGDPQATAQHSFQVLGEQSLTDPNPNRFVEFWTFSHPSISSRAAFAAAYNPWAPGQHPKYFPR